MCRIPSPPRLADGKPEPFEGDRRFDIVVRLSDTLRADPDVLARLPIPVPAVAGAANDRIDFIPLAEVATLEFVLGPNQISREDGKRLVVVSANVRGRDIGSFVQDASAAIAERNPVPPGYWTTWGGQFEQLQAAAKRLQLVVPVALLLVFVLLFMMFNTLRDGLVVFTGIPFALTGEFLHSGSGTFPLDFGWRRVHRVVGVAVLNGLVMIAFIRGC